MRRIFLILLSFACALCLNAANTLSLSSVSGHPGDELTVSVSLTNSEAVTALQADIPLGENLSYVAGSAVLNSARSNGHSMMANETDGTLHIAIFSLANNALRGNEGELLTFRVLLGNEPATYALAATTTMSGTSGSAIESDATAGEVTLYSPKIEVVTTSLDYGHIPIRSTYTKTLQVRNTGNEPLELTAFEFSASEFSVESEQHTIADGQTENIVVTYAPTQHGAITEQLRIRSNAVNAHDVYGANRCTLIADPYSVNELHMQPAAGIADEIVTVTVRMNNMERIAGVQFSLKLPTALEYVEDSATPLERASSHMARSRMSHDTLTVMLFNVRNTPVRGDDGDLLTIRLRLNGASGSYRLTPVKTMLINSRQENMVSAVYSAYVTIQSPAINVPTTADFGSFPVTRPETLNIDVRNTGNAPLTVERATFLMEGFSMLTELPLTVARGTTETLQVQYTPSEEGSFSATMQLYSNDPARRMQSIRLTGEVYEPNSLAFRGYMDGKTYHLAVDMSNYSDITGVQFDIEGLTPWTSYDLGTRAAGKQAIVQAVDETHQRVIIFAMDNTPISGHEGAVIEWTWNAALIPDLNGQTISMNNAVLVHPTKGNRQVTPAAPLTVEAEVPEQGTLRICLGHNKIQILENPYSADIVIHDKTGRRKLITPPDELPQTITLPSIWPAGEYIVEFDGGDRAFYIRKD